MKKRYYRMQEVNVSLQQPAVQTKAPSAWPQWLSNFVETYQKLSTDNLELLTSIYHDDVVFIDPLHQVEGLAELQKYFANLYENLSQCDFVIHEVIVEGNQAAIYWHMAYKHPKLNSGKEVFVSGSSRITGEEGKVIYHRDYLDVGTMLYEHLPIVGRLIKWIKAKAAK